MPETVLTDDKFDNGAISVINLLVESGLCSSNGDARRLIKDGGVTVGDEKITDFAKTYTKDDFAGEFIIKKGKKTFHKFRLAD